MDRQAGPRLLFPRAKLKDFQYINPTEGAIQSALPPRAQSRKGLRVGNRRGFSRPTGLHKQRAMSRSKNIRRFRGQTRPRNSPRPIDLGTAKRPGNLPLSNQYFLAVRQAIKRRPAQANHGVIPVRSLVKSGGPGSGQAWRFSFAAGKSPRTAPRPMTAKALVRRNFLFAHKWFVALWSDAGWVVERLNSSYHTIKRARH